MNRIYKASLVIVTISVFSAHCMQKNATSRKNTESTTRFMVIIDTAAANYFLNKNAIMNYSYKVVSSKNAAEGKEPLILKTPSIIMAHPLLHLAHSLPKI